MPVHSKVHRLKLALEGVAAQSKSGDFEFIIVADNPTMAVRDVLSTSRDARVIETRGLGRAGARNAGATSASGKLLVFIDDDILIGREFLVAHEKAQLERPGMIHGALREIPGLTKIVDPSLGGPGCPPIDIEQIRSGNWQPQNVRLFTSPIEQAAEHVRAIEWPWLASAGANISVPKEIWQKIGGFDEEYGTRWGVEDIDFGYRLWKSGFSINLEADALGYHMSHYNPDRWSDHAENLKRFQQRAICPEAQALGELLSPTGSLDRYIKQVDHIRQLGAVL